MRRHLFCYLFLLLYNSFNYLNGQNLVANPSLEDFENNKIDHWSVISGTPDIASLNNQIVFPVTSGTVNPYYHQGSRRLDSIQFGQICLCQGFNSDWSEVTQVELSESLKRNKKYKISLYYIRVDKRIESITDISVTLTRKPLPITDQPYGYSVSYTSLQKANKSALNASNSWEKVSGIYIASGREKYLSIGNFSGTNESTLKNVKGPVNSLYYCFDNIELALYDENNRPSHSTEKLEPAPVLSEAIVKEQIQDSLNIKAIAITNSYFEFNSYHLADDIDSILNNYAEQLLSYRLHSITVIGHTDNIGTEEYNQQLSEMRALSVKNKLTQLGLDSTIITVVGMGAKKPIADNKTSEGRSKNRRVEIKFY